MPPLYVWEHDRSQQPLREAAVHVTELTLWFGIAFVRHASLFNGTVKIEEKTKVLCKIGDGPWSI